MLVSTSSVHSNNLIFSHSNSMGGFSVSSSDCDGVVGTLAKSSPLQFMTCTMNGDCPPQIPTTLYNLANHECFQQPGSVRYHVAQQAGLLRAPQNTARHTMDNSGLHIQPLDVLFGRGKNHRDHPGNVRMREIIRMYKTMYDRTNRRGKMEITMVIVKLIKETGGRFLRYNHGQRVWREVSNETAREKVSHAMRDSTPSPLPPASLPQVRTGALPTKSGTAGVPNSSLVALGSVFSDEETDFIIGCFLPKADIISSPPPVMGWRQGA